MSNQNGCAIRVGRIVWILVVLFCLLAIGCVSGSNSTLRPSESTDSFIRCEEIRPKICTQEYVPVCGELADGSQKTYSNACSACSDMNVVRYQLDSCS
jgi:Kazal-type serine protease inhibitor domain